MRKKRFIGSMGATLVLVAASLGVAAPSFAQDVQDGTVEALAELNPGTSETQLLAEADGLAEQLGTTPEAILAQQLAEAEESAAAAGRSPSAAQRGKATSSFRPHRHCSSTTGQLCGREVLRV